MVSKIFKNIIFDLGNVIIDLDLEKTERELNLAVGGDLRKKLEDIGKKDLFEEYETGHVSQLQFFETLSEINTSSCGRMRLKDAWNAMLLGTPRHRLQMLSNLKKKYQVFLLSNTNMTHMDWVYRDLAMTHGIQDFELQFFHRAYYSHLVGLRKPHAEIFEYVLQDSKLDPTETLFIDDIAKNLDGAKSLGIHVHHHPVGSEIRDWVQKNL